MELKELEVGDSLLRVALVGDLDHTSAGKIEAKLMASTVSRGTNTIIDLSQVSFISSLGLALLVNSHKGLQRQRKKLVLLAPQPEVLGVLEIARLTTILAVAQDEAAAQSLLAAS